MTRRRFSEREVIETLTIDHEVRCYRCGEPFGAGDKIEREHILEIALGGEDKPHNCAYSHKECHAIATNGTKATTAGSSKHRIAKVARILDGEKTKRGPKLKGRGFQKGIKPKWRSRFR